MKEGVALFWQVYDQTDDAEQCIAELKREGFSQDDTVKILLEISLISSVKANEVVRDSLAWSH